MAYEQIPNVQNKSVKKAVGPKIVAVTSPRPLIVQVQSLTQSGGMSHDPNDIPCEMTIEEGTEVLESEAMLYYQSMKRKRPAKSSVKRIRTKKQPSPPLLEAHVEPSGTAVVIKKLVGKRSKPVSKFTRKKYCCPHCNRRFLTRGNVKNHMRIHSRDKPFQCPICQDYFAYQGVYQRHLLRHRENNEIDDSQLTPLLAESVRLADEITKAESSAVRVIEEGDDTFDEDNLMADEEELEEPEELGEPEEPEEMEEPDEMEDPEELEELEEPEEDEEPKHFKQEVDEADDIYGEANGVPPVEVKSAKIAIKFKKKSKPAGGSRSSVGVHFLCTDDSKTPAATVSRNADDAEDDKDKVKPLVLKRPTPVKSRAKKKDAKDAAGKDPNAPKHRMNYQIIECDFCPMKYHKWSAFYVHRCSHTGETPVLPCGICELEFPNIKALKIHKTTAHPSAVFQCDQCDRSFLSRSALLMHQPVHSTKLNFQCRYCQAKMRTLKERYVHERIHTADETPYQCSHCEKQFNTLVNLRSHLKLHANGTADNTNNTTI